MSTGKIFSDRKIIAAGAVYFLLSFFLLFKYGIQLGGEAEKYIDNANRILNQQELRNGFFGVLYFSYSLVVAFFIKLSIPLAGVAVVQIILSFIAAIALYKLLLHSLQNKLVAFIFFVAYLLCYPVQKWNFYLYSESLHVSLLVIGLYFLYKLFILQQRPVWPVVVLLFIAIIFSRPVGVMFVIAATITGIAWSYYQKNKIIFGALSLLLLAGIFGIAYSPLTTFINPDSLKRMEIICQVPEVNTSINYTEFNRAGLREAFRVIKDEIGIGNFFKNGGKKLIAFFGMQRTYYSSQNNLLLIFHYVFYLLALIGIFLKGSTSFNYLKRFSVVYLLITCIAIFFTCDDWANRFIAPAFPFILILSSLGFSYLYDLFKTKAERRNSN